jgi:hypothetical protein
MSAPAIPSQRNTLQKGKIGPNTHFITRNGVSHRQKSKTFCCLDGNVQGHVGSRVPASSPLNPISPRSGPLRTLF